MLKGDRQLHDLVAISYYDSKSVCFFLTTVMSDIKWDTCGKKVFSKVLKEKVTKNFCDLILLIIITMI